MRRLFRFLATVVVLLGLLPCEMREALPAVGGLVAACCADEASEAEAGEVEAGEHDDDGADCCDTAACLGVARATAPMAGPGALFLDGYLIVDTALHVDRPDRRVGPPPTPPPIA